MKPKKILIPHLYTLYISLDGIAPLIWRRLVVDSSTTLFELHIYMQIVLGWKSYHLYRFNKGGVEFGDPRLWEEDPIIDDRRIALEMVLKKTGDSMQYEYDLGDGWMHTIKLEEINRDEERAFRKAVCLDGENAAPPEDVGGVHGFREFREAIADPDHPEYKSYRQWAGWRYDPGSFDLKKANKGLAGRRSFMFEYNLGIEIPNYIPKIR